MRIGVNIPNDLWRRVKDLNPKVNVSEVCREAIRRYVEIGERAGTQAAADWDTEHAARLLGLVQPPVIEPDWVGFALEDAREWVRQVTPEHWKQFTHLCDWLRRDGRDPIDLADTFSMRIESGGIHRRLNYDAHSEWYEVQYEVHEMLDIPGSPYSRAREQYSRAWIGYVLEVRRKVDEFHEEQRRRVMAERAERLRAFPEPEIPPQLREGGST